MRELMIILKMGGKFQRRVLILEGSLFYIYCIKYYWKNANTYLLLLGFDRGGLERKFSEQNIGAAPPSYEEAVSESRSPVYSER